ncbi:MAG TPA: aldo/keto reductase [Chloroflexota bacterium]|jgi:aryl-alcohol dehydrogenase-like predicted oxidoreductase|nr:aldo/keto reductase [Chloroflexota bacterium]
MRYRQVGNSGLTVSVVGLGGNNFGMRMEPQDVPPVINAALEAGVTFVDSAEMYGMGKSETTIGNALKGRRHEMVIASKFGRPPFRPGMPAGMAPQGPPQATGSRRYIRQAVERSLRALQTDYIDLYYQHFPDPQTPIAETLMAMNELVREGKVCYIGACNQASWQVVEAYWTAKELGINHFIANQTHYSLLERGAEKEQLPASAKYGIGVVPFYPLANGLLTGKYERGKDAPAGSRLAARPGGLSDDVFDRLAPLQNFAAERGLSLLQVGIGGLAAQPAVCSVIAGATKPEQIKANAAAGDWEPSTEDLAALNALP